MHFDGQHLVLTKWIFSIKTDGTYKARLVGRGDLMIPWVDFNPKKVYCGNISACEIKTRSVISYLIQVANAGRGSR